MAGFLATLSEFITSIDKTMSQNTNNLAAFIWSLADLLRGDFKQSQYGRIILPFTLLRRLEGVLADKKEAVLTEFDRLQAMNLPEEAQEKFLLKATGGLSFFNTSKMDLSKLGEANIAANLKSYIQCFSKDAREIFEHFKFLEFIGQLNDANLLYKIVQKVREADLSPQAISNYEMGLVFEELIRRFAESSNETAGEHFTPHDIVRLTTSLVFMEDEIRNHLKIHFPDFKEKQIKDVLEPKLWQDQKALLEKAKKLQSVIGLAQFDDMNAFEETLKIACKKAAVTLDTKEKKQIKDAVSWRNPAAEKVIKKSHKGKANPLYGLFEVNGEVVEYQANSELRDNENVALNPVLSVNEINEAYFKKEVLPHVPDAWIDASKRDDKDGEIGIVGYEIPFNHHFYQYQPPRDLVEIDADLDAVSAEIMKLLQEVHS